MSEPFRKTIRVDEERSGEGRAPREELSWLDGDGEREGRAEVMPIQVDGRRIWVFAPRVPTERQRPWWR
jgi:hypothetical protein